MRNIVNIEVATPSHTSDESIINIKQLIMGRLRGAAIRMRLSSRNFLMLEATDTTLLYANAEASPNVHWTGPRSSATGEPVLEYAVGSGLLSRTQTALQVFDQATADRTAGVGEGKRWALLMADLLAEWVGPE